MHLTNCAYNGTWNGSGGLLNCTQTGSAVTGTYEPGSGRLNGTVIDGVFVGTWSELPSYLEPNDAGDEVLYFTNDCNSLTGVWQYGSHPYGATWNGTLDGIRVPASAQPIATPSTPAHLTNCSYNGIWTSNWDDMNFTQTGSTVTGTYAHDSGRLNGTVIDGIFIGRWSESPSYLEPDDAGDVVLYFANDCNSFSGTWQYGSHPSGAAWDGLWLGTK